MHSAAMNAEANCSRLEMLYAALFMHSAAMNAEANCSRLEMSLFLLNQGSLPQRVAFQSCLYVKY